MKLIIVSGRSGSGKSIALRALEDMGFYCVDNIPVSLLPKLVTLLVEKDIPTAVSIDVRNFPNDPSELTAFLKTVSDTISIQMLYLDTARNTLIRRYSDTRRKHPLSHQSLSLENAIDKEQELLEPLRHHADYIIDTTTLSVHTLTEVLREKILLRKENSLTILFESFGFKYGLPISADYVFDVRFLPNPHWDVTLRSMTGLDQPVIQFLEYYPEVHDFIYQTRNYLEQWLPMLEKNNRSYLTVAIGCTGGKHRSVYITEQLAHYFQSIRGDVRIRHRTLENKNLPQAE